MKAILNWRYYVLLYYYCVGILCVLISFSETENYIPIGEWLINVALALFSGVGCLIVGNRLADYWERRGLIPELTKLTADV